MDILNLLLYYQKRPKVYKSLNSGNIISKLKVKYMPSEEMLFLLENKAKLEDEYSGKYVAIWKRKVIAVGRTVSEVYRLVKDMNIANPLVTYLPKPGEEALLI